MTSYTTITTYDVLFDAYSHLLVRCNGVCHPPDLPQILDVPDLRTSSADVNQYSVFVSCQLLPWHSPIGPLTFQPEEKVIIHA